MAKLIETLIDFLKGLGAPQPQPIPVRVNDRPRRR